MRAIQAIIVRNLTNFSRDRMRLFFTLFMSVFFLFIFSFVMKSTAAGIAQPMNYLISGIIIMTVFQAALNNTMSTLEDISSGFMKEILVSPVFRWQISIGQIFSSSIVAVLQGAIVLILGFFMGLRIDAIHTLTMLGVMLLVGVTFSSIGLFLATVAKNSSTFQLMISVVVMPLTFLSGAYIPTTVMPCFLRPIVYINPLTYTTAVFRYISLHLEHLSASALVQEGVAFNINGFVILPDLGLLIIIVIGIVFFALCVKQFNKADFSKVKSISHHH